MEIQRKNLDIIFRRNSPTYIFNNIKNSVELNIDTCFLHNNLKFNVFNKCSCDVYAHYSENEVLNIYDIMNREQKSEWNSSVSIFNLLYKYGEKVLLSDDSVPICRYDEILNWSELTNKLGQDIITTSYLAYEDLCHNEMTTVFSWRPILKTDNTRLHKIMEKGLAENHYHLNGSTQIFPLSWICAMNNYSLIDSIADKFEVMLDTDVLAKADYRQNDWSIQLKRAAIIRAYLFKQMVESNDENEEKTEFLNESDDTKYKTIKTDILNQGEMVHILEDLNLNNYQEIINSLKYRYAYRTEESNYIFDYAIMKNLHEQNYNSNRTLVGERFFLYQCFRKIYSNNFTDFNCNLFYLYLVIKSQFRGELVQVNDRVGFKNFANYQDRKGYITDLKPCYEQEVYNLALNATLEDQHIQYLEARIMPKNSAKKVKQSIEFIDEIKRKTQNSSDIMKSIYLQANHILDGDNIKENSTERYCFILHFLKSAFKLDKDENSCFIGKCRNHELRKENQKRAKAVANALANNYNLRKRIKGIDGCANEIGCRPETLATELRYLNNYNPVSTLSFDYQNKEPISLRLTFHVGEDFLDIVDGLRAIDEAVYFINLKRNDRIGHALALGINVNDYYQSKNNKVFMPKQDLLDNLIWIQYKADLLNVDLSQRLRNQISILADDLLTEIYKKFADDNGLSLNKDLYLHSWMLRGDDPALYRKGRYIYQNDINSEYIFYSKNPYVSDAIRYNNVTALIYYAYHFDNDVKRIGQEKCIYKVDTSLINLVSELQKRFQFEIAKTGIAIECNPSSNYLIGTFKGFDKHPIKKFYNRSLEIEENKIKESPQLSVSINTDDQGVFDTYLENEYALMASALEKLKNNDGQSEYSSIQIYSWLDDIRQMGLEQSFYI